MECTNKHLYLTLSQDVKELKKLSEEIQKKANAGSNGKIWLLPNSSRDVSPTSYLDNKQANVYIVCLELIIDRLYVILNNVTKFLDDFCICATKSKRKNVVKPKNFTLGTLAKNFWKKILQVEYMMNVPLKSCMDLNATIVSREVQTEIMSLVTCDSCDSAKACIKIIVNELENVLLKPAVAEAKKKIQLHIYDMTQFGSMSCLTEAVRTDLKKLVEKAEDLEYAHSKDEQEINFLQTNLQGADSKLSELESKYNLLDTYYKKEQEVSVKILKEIEDISQINDDLQVKNEQQKSAVENLAKRVDDLQANVSELEQQKEVLVENLSILSKEKYALSSDRDKWKEKCNLVNTEKLELTCKYRQLQEKIPIIEATISQIKFAEAKDVSGQYYKEICEQQADCQKTLLEIKESVKELRKRQQEKKTEISNIFDNPQLIKDSRVRGDPFADMTSQLEINKQNIEILVKQNEKLTKILLRFPQKKVQTNMK